MHNSRWLGVAGLVVSAAGLAACGDATVAAGDDAGAERALAAVAQAMTARVEMPTRDMSGGGLDELAPDTPVILGSVIDVEPGVGRKSGSGDPGAGDNWVDTTFTDPDAAIRTYELTVSVEEVLVGDYALDEVQVGVSLGARLPQTDVETALLALGDAVWYLYDGSPVYSYEPSLKAIWMDGGIVIRVDSSGNLSMPFVYPETSEVLLGSWATVDDVRDDLNSPADDRPARQRTQL